MYFLGQAANFRGRTLTHVFAHGKKADFEALKSHLAARYNVSSDQVYLYHNGRSALSAGLRSVGPRKMVNIQA